MHRCRTMCAYAACVVLPPMAADLEFAADLNRRPCAEALPPEEMGRRGEVLARLRHKSAEANLDEGQYPVMPTGPPTEPCQLGGGLAVDGLKKCDWVANSRSRKFA